MEIISIAEFAPTKSWYGTNQLDVCIRPTSLIPEQIIGLSPCRILQNPCDYRPYIEQCILVLAESVFTCSRNNDFSSFLFQFAGQTGNDFRLQEKQPNGSYTNIATLNNNTYGTFFNFGAFPSYPYYSGFKIDWRAVFLAFGKGTYRFIVNDALTPANTLYSYDFKLLPFTAETSDTTIRIETEFSGEITNLLWSNDYQGIQRFDLVNMTWSDQIRHIGFFGNLSPKQEQRYVKYSSDANKNVYSGINHTYKADFNELAEELIWRLSAYAWNAKKILISDYNRFNPYHFTDFDAKMISEQDPNYYTYTNRHYVYSVEFGRRNDTIFQKTN